jgi:hypothetical protein
VLQGPADLAVSQVRNPVLPAVLKVNAAPRGAAVVDVQNVSTGRFKGQIKIDVQLSPDGQWGDANPILKTVYRNIAMPMRVNGKRTFRIALPRIGDDVAQGTYRIAVKITVAGENASATGNNTGAGWKTTFTGTPGVSSPTPPPSDPTPPPTDPTDPAPTYVDLTVSASIGAGPLEAGTQTTMSFTITNVGTGVASGPIGVDLWAGPHNASDSSGDLYIGGTGGAINLAPGESKTFSTVVNVPIELDGPTYFKAEIYDVYAIDLGDVNMTNNQVDTGSTVEIWHHDVNLVGSWAFADTTDTAITVQRGDTVNLRLDLTNTGTETFTGPVSVSGSRTDGSPWLSTSQQAVTLTAGESKSIVVQFTVPPLVASGDYTLSGVLQTGFLEGTLARADNDLAGALSVHVQ